ncbi:hypothetical protein, partial [Nonomuraea jabiensis]|uniref:hypothetical protein n=1 Tax=Nonomuraea jabiensis TaxID=882448 RepID=UPI003D71D8A4
FIPAKILVQTLTPEAHISFPSVYQIRTILVKPPDPVGSGLASLRGNPANLLQLSALVQPSGWNRPKAGS